MMGALTELYDAELSRTAYRIADGIYNDEIDYFELGREYVTLTEITDYLTDLREILARMLLIACGADADWAYELIDQYADGADQWITAFEEEERDLRIEKMIQEQLEVEKVKELNRIKQNKPKVSE